MARKTSLCANGPPARRGDHGKGARKFRDQQLRPDSRDCQPVDGRPMYFPDRRRLEPDLYDFRRLAARGRALGAELGECCRVAPLHVRFAPKSGPFQGTVTMSALCLKRTLCSAAIDRTYWDMHC